MKRRVIEYNPPRDNLYGCNPKAFLGVSKMDDIPIGIIVHQSDDRWPKDEGRQFWAKCILGAVVAALVIYTIVVGFLALGGP